MVMRRKEYRWFPEPLSPPISSHKTQKSRIVIGEFSNDLRAFERELLECNVKNFWGRF
jgi:hypothetical protein